MEKRNYKMRAILLIATVFWFNCVCAQIGKDSLLKRDVIALVEELEFMYGYDQTMREYTIYKTFDKSETNRIENLTDSLKRLEMEKRKFESDSMALLIWRRYINPKDSVHTQRLIRITQKYGFPSIRRIRNYYDKKFVDQEFNPIILFIHSPQSYWDELKELMSREHKEGRINRCEYGYLLWHFSGRKSLQPMLDNGFVVKEENRVQKLVPTCK